MNPLAPTARRLFVHYRTAPLAGRLYVFARVLTCPFDAVAARLPAQGTLLDVGCGSGLFAHLASARGLHVTGYDPDPRKVALARASVQPGETIDIHEGTLDTAATSGRRYEAVVFLDVLYLVPPDEQARQLRTAAGLLSPGGRLLVKTMHDESPVRSALDGMQEAVATGIGMTKGEALKPPSEAFVRQVLEAEGLRVTSERIDRGYLHPHLLVVGDAP